MYQRQLIKRCTGCGAEKPVGEFYHRSGRIGGKASRCRDCCLKYNREHREACNRALRKSYAKTRAKRLGEMREYYWKDPEAARARVRRYREEHQDAVKSYNRAYRRAHLEAGRLMQQKRRARKKGSGGTYTQKEWGSLVRRFNHHCVRCGAVDDITADHIVPLSQGGLNVIENLQPLCRSCNSSKGVAIADYRRRGTIAALMRSYFGGFEREANLAADA